MWFFTSQQILHMLSPFFFSLSFFFQFVFPLQSKLVHLIEEIYRVIGWLAVVMKPIIIKLINASARTSKPMNDWNFLFFIHDFKIMLVLTMWHSFVSYLLLWFFIPEKKQYKKKVGAAPSFCPPTKSLFSGPILFFLCSATNNLNII